MSEVNESYEIVKEALEHRSGVECGCSADRICSWCARRNDALDALENLRKSVDDGANAMAKLRIESYKLKATVRYIQAINRILLITQDAEDAEG